MGVAYNYHSAQAIPYIIGTVAVVSQCTLHNLLAVCCYSTPHGLGTRLVSVYMNLDTEK